MPVCWLTQCLVLSHWNLSTSFPPSLTCLQTPVARELRGVLTLNGLPQRSKFLLVQIDKR
jgi:hypothetical protein